MPTSSRSCAPGDRTWPTSPDLDLIEAEILDSLGFMVLLTLLEERTGHEFDLDTVTREDYRTLARMEERLLARLPDPGPGSGARLPAAGPGGREGRA
ncbi:hypothetical protein GCM10020295_16110 [Streptomyces cinereospinus]